MVLRGFKMVFLVFWTFGSIEPNPPLELRSHRGSQELHSDMGGSFTLNKELHSHQGASLLHSDRLSGH